MFGDRRKRRLAAGIVLAVAVVAGGGMAFALSAGDHERPITGEALEKASAAALAYTGGGRVTDTEVGDEEGYYEVEVTLDDGAQIDVHLDENFNVLSADLDDEGPDDDD